MELPIKEEFNEEEVRPFIPPPESPNATVIPLAKLDLIDRPLEGGIRLDLSKYRYSSLEHDKVISYGNHSFLSGMITAYRMHKSITLSPDIIWLLIVQGFSYHLAANNESLRSMIVSFEGKKELTVKRLDLTPETATKNDWIDIVDEFIKQINENTKDNITDVLEHKFSTTTKTAHTAGIISIMSALKHYFDYKVVMMGCGYPSITLEGTVEDWELVKGKAQALSKYNLEWWISELTPILDEFIKAKKGEINRQFWLDMIRFKDPNGLYDPGYIDGWICKFFPYDKFGEKRHFGAILETRYGIDRIFGERSVPSEILNTPFILEILGLGDPIDINCQLDSGFIGLQETRYAPGVYNVKPIIGWGLIYNAPQIEKPDKWRRRRPY